MSWQRIEEKGFRRYGRVMNGSRRRIGIVDVARRAGVSVGTASKALNGRGQLRAETRDRVRAAGVGIPLIPGVMPVTNFTGLKRMSASCGAAVPDWLAAHFDGLDDDPETRKLIAASVAAEMCARLQEEGFEDFHFYTLNRADLVYAICRVLGVREQAARS